MAGTRIFEVKDMDQRWWKFSEQNKNCSCGPTCVKTAKELYFNKIYGEDAMRGLLGLIIQEKLHTGKKLLEADIETCPIWDAEGTIERVVLKAMQKEPGRIPQARLVHGIGELRLCSRNYPAILGFNWEKGGGHFVVCVGPTRADPDLFVILDPWFGLHYLSAQDAVGNALFYVTPDASSRGQIDGVGYIVTRPV